jgi:hypothetical protein
MNTPAYFCMDHITPLNDGSVSVAEPAIASTLQLYPNPANDVLRIENDAADNSMYRVYDALGQLVMSGHLTQNQLDISQLGNGLYILRVAGMVGRFMKG